MELQALKMYLMSQYGVERVDALFWEIQMIILRSLLAVSQVMINDKHCFELYVSSVLLIIALFVIIFASVSVFYFQLTSPHTIPSSSPLCYRYGYDVMIDAELKPWLIEVNASPSLTANTRDDYLMKTEMLHGMIDVVDMEGLLTGNEEHVSGWDLVYDNGYIEIDPEQCGYSTFLGAAVPEPEEYFANNEDDTAAAQR